MLAMDIVQTLVAEPGDDLMVADHQCAGALGDGDGVADVIAVAMADQDEFGET